MAESMGGIATLDDESTNQSLDEFAEALVPSHMHKRFFKTFGVPKAAFGNRFFKEGTAYHPLERRISEVGFRESTHVLATVIYASADEIEAHRLRGETRRSFRDLFIDDWHAAACFVEAEEGGEKLFLFIEPKMRGCIALHVQG